ncbi:MAG TPA: hypothetical protein PLJ47_14100, partial [Candidatus Hydrogenedentes bacterium]|nr:hypothetical protein [Candidatus Hydrogenedentota bacterium]
MADLRLSDAVYAQPAGAVGFVVCALLLAASLSTVMFGSVPPLARRAAQRRSLLFFGAVVFIGGWMFKLATG